MTYAERKQLLVGSGGYRRAIRVIGVGCVGYAVVIDAVVLLSSRSGSGVPGGSLARELSYWVAAAGLMFLACLVVLRFVAPALMTEDRLRKLAGEP